MTYAPPASVFTSVRQHFANPRYKDEALVKLPAGTPGAQPVGLTADEAHEALYGPGSTAQLADAVWAAALSSARTDPAPHGTARLLVLWLALPQLTRTAHRISRRVRAELGDVESELAMAVLEELASPEPAAPSSVSPLLKAARTRAWAYARSGLREIPSARVERITEEQAIGSVYDVPEPPESPQELDVRVDRAGGPDGPRASLRFRVRAEHLRGPVLVDARTETGARPPCHSSRRHRSGRRVGTLPIRPTAKPA